MNQISDKKLTLQIAGLQGVYWMLFCPIYSYASVFLLSNNFSNQNIGWVMAVSNILAIVLQPLMGALIDKTAKVSLKGSLVLLSTLSLALLSGLILLDLGLFWMAVLYVGIMAFLITLQPLVNALTFEYINAGHNISFGITRAAGSICFAVLSTLLGIWVSRTSTDILPITCLVLLISFLVLVLSFPNMERRQNSISVQKSSGEPSTKQVKVGFLRKYSRFIPFLISIACLYVFHSIINTYLAQIMASLGGKDTDFGVSLTIAAVCELPAFLGFSYLVSKIKIRSLLKISGVFYLLRSFIFLLAASVWVINLGQVFQAFSFAVFIPASVYYINEMMREEDRVKGQTFITGTSTLGAFFGSVIGGWLLDLYGVPSMLAFAAAGAVAGCLLMVYASSKPKK